MYILSRGGVTMIEFYKEAIYKEAFDLRGGQVKVDDMDEDEGYFDGVDSKGIKERTKVISDFIRNHPRFNDAVKDTNERENRSKIRHPLSAPVEIGITYGIPAALGILTGKATKSFKKGLGMSALTLLPSGIAGAATGVYMDDKQRDKIYGSRKIPTDAYRTIYDDLEKHMHKKYKGIKRQY